MTKHKEIKGILFDSGDTLVHPIGGKWWPGDQFHEILDNYNIRELSWSRMEGALEEGIRYLVYHHHLMTVDEEREQFRTFYRILLEHLGLRNPDTSLISALAHARVDEIDLNSSTIRLPLWRDCTSKDFRSVLYRTLGHPLKESTDYLTYGNILRHSSSQPKWDAVSPAERFSEGRLWNWNCRPKNYCLWRRSPLCEGSDRVELKRHPYGS